MVSSGLSTTSLEWICVLCLVILALVQSHGSLGNKLEDSLVTLNVGDSSQIHRNENEIVLFDAANLREAKSKKGQGGNMGGLAKRILPYLIIPFLISSAVIPIMLKSIKILLIKGFIVGKIGIILMLINFFRRRVNGGGVFNHYAPNWAQEHYGYQGIEEPGAYIHQKRRKRAVKLY